MPIYNINGKTEELAAIRYIRNGVTEEISRVYAIEDGKTVLVFDSDDANILYLYNEGDECIDVTGGWSCALTSAPNSCKKQESYIEMCLGKGEADSLLAAMNNNIDYSKYQTLGIMYDYIGDDTVIAIDEYQYEGANDCDEIFISPFHIDYSMHIQLISGTRSIAYFDLKCLQENNEICDFWFSDYTTNVNKKQDAILKIRKVWLETSDNKDSQTLQRVENLFAEAFNTYLRKNHYGTTLYDINELFSNILIENKITNVTYGLNWSTVINISLHNTYTTEITVNLNCNGLNSYFDLKYTLPSVMDLASDVETIIDNSISNMTVTNDTTQASIQNLVNTVLSNNGITQFTATVGTLDISKATSSYSGSIEGLITITLKRTNQNCTYCYIDKTIPILT